MQLNLSEGTPNPTLKILKEKINEFENIFFRNHFWKILQFHKMVHELAWKSASNACTD